MFPLNRTLIDTSLMTDNEINWVDEYHTIVREKLLGDMKEYSPQSVEYLMRETEPLK